ncbi:hypothetical protein GCM10009804_70240 [Kribbella hippodromi]|uniref:N,N-dimethylformamidase beta subunit-like C-terminal domain-containing protein n=1 Tax=Kribbella hippodromi TaxID=434347 RepID=A0ABN2EHX5_9ACTN
MNWRPTRRAVLTSLGIAGVGGGAAVWWFVDDQCTCTDSSTAPIPTVDKAALARVAPTGLRRPSAVITRENSRRGSNGWNLRAGRTSDDKRRQIQGYASATSVQAGEELHFHLSCDSPQQVRIDLYRLGFYNGKGGRLVLSSPPLHAETQQAPRTDPSTRLVWCEWTRTWTVRIPADWVSGYYQAVFTRADGVRAGTVFVVRDDAAASEVLVVLPFTTYAAYNWWPRDGQTGSSLYGIEGAKGKAKQVSFDRPYHENGLPSRHDLDHRLIWWLEQQGFDCRYATSVDLHEGRVDPARHRLLVSSGHDEYYSDAMRSVVLKARSHGTNLAFFGANAMYWRVRLEAGRTGGTNRIVTCYKSKDDPERSAPTRQWRQLDQPEQALMGSQYTSRMKQPHPLVVSSPEHWMWAGTGVQQGTQFPRIVAVEADRVMDEFEQAAGSEHATLTSSPFCNAAGDEDLQQTVLHRAPAGGYVWNAGTFHWSLGLSHPRLQDPRLQRATYNLLTRMLGHD